MKNQRHNAIKDLLEKNAASSHAGIITNQDDLRRKLAAKGIHVTQATLSRDIRELRLQKNHAGYSLPGSYTQAQDPDRPTIHEVLETFCLEVRQAQNLLVVLSSLGGAQPIAAAMDQEEWDEVIGTIAGDNTTLVVCADSTKAATLKARIEAHIA